MMDFPAIVQLLDSSLRLSTPLLPACLAGLFSERAGIFDIGPEGKMLAAAFIAGALSAVSGAAVVGMLAGLLRAIGNKYQNPDFYGIFTVPVQSMQALPYILTVVILAGFLGKAIPPKASGQPYVKER